MTVKCSSAKLVISVFASLLSLLVLRGQISAAIISPPQPGATDLYDPEEFYFVGTQLWVTQLSPASVQPLPLGGTSELNALLEPFKKPVSEGGGGWSISPATSALAGTFQINTYDALGSPTQVGAVFVLTFQPGTGDPTGVEFHWIQRVFDNHAITGGHGDPEDVIDATLEKPLTDPGRLFYDFDVTFATPPHFEDMSTRSDGNMSHFWGAELSLVSIPSAGSKEVTIYEGVSWGWVNYPVPEPSTITLLSIGTFGLVGYCWRRRKRTVM
jgi:hypothetical protein